MRRHFNDLWHTGYDGTFGDFLREALARSHCDQFAVEHFRHSIESGGGYIFEGDIQELEQQIAEFAIEAIYKGDN